MKLPDWLDSVWHLLGGAAFGLVVGALAPGHLDWRVALGSAAVAALGGLGRELWQHRNDTPQLNLHRVIEGLAWGVGAGLGALL